MTRDSDFILKFLAFANPDVDTSSPMGQLAASHLGRYLIHYDLDARTPEEMIMSTPFRSQALGFSDRVEAAECWRRSKGTRPDGQPDRPLTAYTVSIIRRV